VSVFWWNEQRILNLEARCDRLELMQQIDGGNVERMSQRLTSYERNAHLYNTLTQALKPKANILDTKGEPIVSSCSKDRIFELRLQALEQGKPVALADLVQEALEELQLNGTSYKTISTGPHTWDYKQVHIVGPGYDKAIALLEYATSLTKGEEV
jgi:hypothetical protein